MNLNECVMLMTQEIYIDAAKILFSSCPTLQNELPTLDSLTASALFHIS